MDERIHTLAKRGIYLGTSSWKYEGWRGLVYHDTYQSDKDFKDRCLAEYARQFTTVGADHTYYAWPMESTLRRYAEQTPETFRFGFKVTEEVTVLKYPKLKRYGKRAGIDNPHFLDARLFEERFLAPLKILGPRVGPIMFEFSQFYPGMIASGSEFTAKLDHFFSSLSDRKGLLLAVEIRNASWLKPPYFEMLARHQVSHVFSSWTRMPKVGEQLRSAKGFRFPAFVSRLLLQPGTKYEEAVEAFAPYKEIQELQVDLRRDAANLIQSALDVGVPAYVFVNNRAEGSAPLTIQGILECLA